MKTIKIIDLLNKIANGEEVPKLIKFKEQSLEYDEECFDYCSDDKFIFADTYYLFKAVFKDGKNHLNDEVEILDEEDEFEDIESFGVHYSWDYIDYKNIEELKKYVNKDFQNIFDTLDKLIKNQKKIIEKLKKQDNN